MWTIDEVEFVDLFVLKNWLLALTEFTTVSTGVLVVLVRSSSLMFTKLFWKGGKN